MKHTKHPHEEVQQNIDSRFIELIQAVKGVKNEDN